MDKGPGTINFWKNAFGSGGLPTPSAVGGSRSFPNDFMRFGAGGLQNDFCRA